jgi:hypothetical protein
LSISGKLNKEVGKVKVQKSAGETLNPVKPVSIRCGGLAKTQRRRDYFNNLPLGLRGFARIFFITKRKKFTFLTQI